MEHVFVYSANHAEIREYIRNVFPDNASWWAFQRGGVA